MNFPAIVRRTVAASSTNAASCSPLFNLALRKRPVSTEQIDSAIERIEEKLLNLGQREVNSGRIRRAGDA